MKKFVSYIKASNYQQADIMMRTGSIIMYGQLSTLAYIAYGDRIPKDWKTKSKDFIIRL